MGSQRVFFCSSIILAYPVSLHFNRAIVKFLYSEKATKFCKIFPLLLTTVHTVNCKGKISQNFVAFSEYINFRNHHYVYFVGRK